jgi:hypothetical protein
MSREQLVRDAVDRLLAGVRQDTDHRLEALAAELLQIVQGDARTSRVDVERAAIEVARAVAKGGAHARHDLISRVVVAIRRLDDAASLRGILDALADGASAETSQMAVLLVEAETLRSYRHYGFAAGAAPDDVPRQAVPLLASAIALRQTTNVPVWSETSAAAMPAFMRVPAGHLGLIVPLVVGREVVALVYVQGPVPGGDVPGAPVWTEQVEVIVRHASARLETVTSQRTVEVLGGR